MNCNEAPNPITGSYKNSKADLPHVTGTLYKI